MFHSFHVWTFVVVVLYEFPVDWEFGKFWSVRKGESGFDAHCQANRIKHILGGIGKPTTLGKIERWLRTYDLEHARFSPSRLFVEL